MLALDRPLLLRAVRRREEDFFFADPRADELVRRELFAALREREDAERDELLRAVDFRALVLRAEPPARDRLRDDPLRVRELELDLRAAMVGLLRLRRASRWRGLRCRMQRLHPATTTVIEELRQQGATAVRNRLHIRGPP